MVEVTPVRSTLTSKPEPKQGTVRRSVLIHDASSFLVLTTVTVLLFGITLTLFRTFEAHREELGRSWAEQGRAALARHDPQAAVPALRAALSYAPDNRAEQLLLAEALAGSGHENEANSYFLNLWTTRPGDGFVNLQLARLARRRGDAVQAVESYRAAIFGDWGDQGATRRRECRLELAEYLIERKDLLAARTELLIAASNAPESAPILLRVGELLAAAEDFPDALGLFERAMGADRANATALVRAEAAALVMGQYARAEEFPTHAERELHRSSGRVISAEMTTARALARDAGRLDELSFSRELPGDSRRAHLLAAADLAQARLRTCTTPAATAETRAGKGVAAFPGTLRTSTVDPALAALNARWKTSGRDLRRRASAGNAGAQEGLGQLLLETEVAASSPAVTEGCGAPNGDDLLLLVLGQREGLVDVPPFPALTLLNAQWKALAAGMASSYASLASDQAETRP